MHQLTFLRRVDTASRSRRAVLAAVLGACSLLTSTAATAQAWPSKPIKLLVGFPPGGGIDTVARNLQPGLQEALGQTVIVDYKPGAGGVLAATELMRSPNDGYTILVANLGPFILAPNMMAKAPFDPLKDFTWIAQTSGSGFIAAVPAELGVNTLAEFLAWAKANAATANFASGGNGSITHLNGEMLNQATGLKMVHVPYKGSSPAVQDLLSGRTHLMVDVAAVLMPHIQSGKLKAIYVTDAKRVASLPAVPTAREAGFPALEATGWQGIVGPAGMPKAVVDKIAAAIAATLAKSDVQQRFAQTGSAVIERGPQEYAEFIGAEVNRWAPVVRASGAKL